MNIEFDQPKTFKELIDIISIFLSKRFNKLFLIVLLLVGPFFILRYIFLFLSDKPFISQIMGVDDMRLAILKKLSYPVLEGRFEFYARIASNYPILVMMPFAFVAITLAISQLKRGWEFSVKSVIKDSLSKFLPIVSSCITFGVTAVIAYFFPTIIIQPIVDKMVNSLTWGIPLAYVLTISVYMLLGYILIRFLFFLPHAYEGDEPSLKMSWFLTDKKLLRTIFFGIFLTSIILLFRYMLESIFLFLLGNSILFIMIMDAYSLISLLVIMVSYAVLFFDFANRHESYIFERGVEY